MQLPLGSEWAETVAAETATAGTTIAKSAIPSTNGILASATDLKFHRVGHIFAAVRVLTG